MIFQSSTPDYREADSDVTVHFKLENSLIGIPILDRPINYYKNKKNFIKETVYSRQKVKIKKLFDQKYQRFIVQITKHTFETEMTKLIKEYLVPNCNYYIYFELPIYEKVTKLIQKNFIKVPN